MGLSLVTAPSAEPISTSEAKAHLRVDSSSEDTLIDALVVSARQWVEGYLHRALVTQTWDWTMEDFRDCLQLPMLPVASVTSVKYYDPSNAQQTLSTSVYQVDLASKPARIALAYGQAWPATYERLDAVAVRFVAGYGNAAAVPQQIKQAILLLVGHWYKNRESTATGLQEIPQGVQALLWPLRVPGFLTWKRANSIGA